ERSSNGDSNQQACHRTLHWYPVKLQTRHRNSRSCRTALCTSSTLDELLALNPVTYNWKTESATTSPHTGFIAQEVQPVFPDLISSGPDGYLTMNHAGLTPYLVKAQQEIASITGA